MAQHDYSIANQSGAAFRSDLNNALSAIVSQNSGASEPSTTYAYMTWADTTNGVMKMRNGANSAWITLYQLDGEWTSIAFENGTAAAPSIYFKDSGTDTGFFSPGTDSVGITTGGTERLRFASTGALGLSGANYGNSGQLLTSNGSGSAPTWQDLSLSNVGDGTAAAPSIAFSADTNTGIYRPGADQFAIATGGTARLYVGSTGSVGIGSTAPNYELQINASDALSAIQLTNTSTGTTASDGFIVYNNGVNATISNEESGYLRFQTAGTERAQIDSSGRLLVGTSSDISGGETNAVVQAANSNGGVIVTGRTDTTVTSGEVIGGIDFSTQTGASSTWQRSARILCFADADQGNGDSPGRLTFSTTADGASSPTERMRIDSSGYLSGYTNGLGAGRIPAMQFYRLNSALVGANSTADQSVLGAGVTLVSSTVYAFEGLFIFTKSATGTTSHTVSLGFGGTATINNIFHMALSTALSNATGVGYDGTPTGYMANTAAYTVASGSASGAQSRAFIIRGSVSINAGGTFIPQYKLSAAPGSAYSTVAGSYFSIWPLGASGANTSIGTWA